MNLKVLNGLKKIDVQNNLKNLYNYIIDLPELSIQSKND